MNTKQLIKSLKNAKYFGVVRDGENFLLYTNCMILSSADMIVDNTISMLCNCCHVKLGETYRWGESGRVDCRQVPNVSKVYNEIMLEPREKAHFSYRACDDSCGNIIGYEFSVDGETKILSNKYFHLFEGSEFSFASGSESFVVDRKHIVMPIQIYKLKQEG